MNTFQKSISKFIQTIFPNYVVGKNYVLKNLIGVNHIKAKLNVWQMNVIKPKNYKISFHARLKPRFATDVAHHGLRLLSRFHARLKPWDLDSACDYVAWLHLGHGLRPIKHEKNSRTFKRAWCPAVSFVFCTALALRGSCWRESDPWPPHYQCDALPTEPQQRFRWLLSQSPLFILSNVTCFVNKIKQISKNNC